MPDQPGENGGHQRQGPQFLRSDRAANPATQVGRRPSDEVSGGAGTMAPPAQVWSDQSATTGAKLRSAAGRVSRRHQTAASGAAAGSTAVSSTAALVSLPHRQRSDTACRRCLPRPAPAASAPSAPSLGGGPSGSPGISSPSSPLSSPSGGGTSSAGSPSVHSASAGTGAQGADAAKAAAGGQPTGLPPQTAPLTQPLANTPLAAQPPAPTPPPAPAPVPDAPAPPPSAPAPSAPRRTRCATASFRWRRPRRWRPSGARDAARTATNASARGTLGASRCDGAGRHIDRARRRARLRGRCDQRCGSACARTGFSLARRARRDRGGRDRWSVAPPIHRR